MKKDLPMPTHQDWQKAGQIAQTALLYGKDQIKVGVSYNEILEKVEKKIAELGGTPAFPPQMALNDTAAHFTTNPDEDVTIKEDVVSLDIGVSVNGAIGDNALTVDLSGQWTELNTASKEALNAAIKTLQSNELRLGQIGKAIQETIESYGFSPVKNLSGHGLGPYTVHKSPSVPNYDTGDSNEIPLNSYFAIEPFATNGVGLIHETELANIFSLQQKRPVRSQITREVLKKIEQFNGFPFASRDIKGVPLFKLNFALKELAKEQIIHAYPPLVEKGHGMVAQTEHSFYVGEDRKVEVLTQLKE